jgi:hypothetical protein
MHHHTHEALLWWVARDSNPALPVKSRLLQTIKACNPNLGPGAGNDPAGNGHLPSTGFIRARLSPENPGIVARPRIELGRPPYESEVYSSSRAIQSLAGVTGIEPASFGFGDRRSTRLNFTPVKRNPGAEARVQWLVYTLDPTTRIPK